MTDKTNQNPLQRSATSSSWLSKHGLGISVGGVIGFLLSALIFSQFEFSSSTTNSGDSDTNEPLYWVAPMDPNFKRDKPGKSPMGMDLIPVYADDIPKDAPGTVSIDPVLIQNLGVKTTTVESVIPNTRFQAIGSVEYAEDAIEHVHPRVEGWIEILYVRAIGEFVEKGEPLYSLYSPELVNAQEEFIIALSQNNTGLINAAQMRLQTLGMSESMLKRLRTSRQVSHTVTFLAPQSGFINELNVQKGFYVKPSMTLLSVASLDRVWFIADIFPTDANKVNLGQKATIVSEDNPGQEYEVMLDHIYPSLNADTRTVQVRFVIDNVKQNVSEQLKPGMYGVVSIHQDKDNTSKVLAVPKQAVIRSGNSNRVVLALGDGKFKSINVQLGRAFNDVFEVLQGLVEGDEIVTSAQFLLDSESSITSDFKRINFEEDNAEKDISAWTHATVNEVNREQRMVNLTHGYLDAFDMMGMTMNFTVSDELDINEFQEGASVHVEIIREPSGMYQVKTLHKTDSHIETNDQTHKSEHEEHKGVHE